MVWPSEFNEADGKLHHANVQTAWGQSTNAIRRARALHNNLYKLNVRAQKIAEVVFGRRIKLGSKPTDTLDVLLAESKEIGKLFVRARPQEMSPAEMRRHHANLNALVSLLKQCADDAEALGQHWTEMHRLLDQVAAIYQK
ncbi:MAG TPA: hypothetical protein VGH29_09900 [Candidatus Binataceae bacterium]